MSDKGIAYKTMAKAPVNLPKACWIWDNPARKEFLMDSSVTTTFLGLLVATTWYSARFLSDSMAARWVLGGFVLEHAIVAAVGRLDLFSLRRGIVSLLHLTCWSPGWFAVISEVLKGVSDEDIM